MEELKYYTPEIEDIRVEYEFEYCSDKLKDIWNKTIFTGNDEYEIYSLGRIYNIKQLCNTTLLRTQYLTKEQIEAEGWKHIGGKLMSAIGQEYEYRGWDLTYSELNQNCLIERKNFIRDGSGNWYNKITYFKGKIKSINEFRTLCKWLGIC